MLKDLKQKLCKKNNMKNLLTTVLLFVCFSTITQQSDIRGILKGTNTKESIK